MKMSAREMQCFIHFFPLLVDDLVNQNDPTWIFLINCIKMIDLLLLPSYDSETILKLENVIINHNKKYVELFNDTLKPKHHFLNHYCTIIKKSGPLK